MERVFLPQSSGVVATSAFNARECFEHGIKILAAVYHAIVSVLVQFNRRIGGLRADKYLRSLFYTIHAPAGKRGDRGLLWSDDVMIRILGVNERAKGPDGTYVPDLLGTLGTNLEAFCLVYLHTLSEVYAEESVHTSGASTAACNHEASIIDANESACTNANVGSTGACDPWELPVPWHHFRNEVRRYSGNQYLNRLKSIY